MSATPCHDECIYLIRMAERLAGSMTGVKTELRAWFDEADSLRRFPNLESLKGELMLERLSLQLRTLWLRYANSISSCYLKSPPTFQTVRMPSGNSASFPYDRWNTAGALETRATNYHPVPAGWMADHVLFNSGMGAMICLLQVMRSMFQPRPDSPLAFHGVGGYFEIMDMLNANHDNLFKPVLFTDQKQFQQSVARGESQLIYIEPVSTMFSMQVLDLEGFLEAWGQRTNRLPTVLLFDPTLGGNTSPIEEVLTRLNPHKPGVVIQISSTLKLDQEGLEFSNAGLMSIYSTAQANVNDIAMRMRKYRPAMGLGLMWEQIAALDYPGFLDRKITDRHSASIFNNNAYIAQQLEAGNDLLFAEKSHPVLHGMPDSTWSVAPFVYVRLREGSSNDDRHLLKHVIHAEASKRDLSFQPGSSFGFRAHRIEMGGIRDDPGTQTIRVAMGCRRGPSLDEALKLLNEINRMGTFEKLAARYPQLAGVVRKFGR